MSRKDTIIIALLINAGLLALLFMLAVNVDGDKVDSLGSDIAVEKPVASPMAPPSVVAYSDPNPADEVDRFLKDLGTEERSPQSIIFDDEPPIELAAEAATPAFTSLPPAKAERAKDPDYVTITVKRGDALEKIARSNGTTVEAIRKVNNLTSTKLAIGQTLRIPKTGSGQSAVVSAEASSAPKPAPTPASVSMPAYDIQYYIIKSGDNPWKVAKQFNVKFEELLRLNNLDEEKARNLKIGDKIRVR